MARWRPSSPSRSAATSSSARRSWDNSSGGRPRQGKMTVVYEIWEISSGNLIGTYTTEAEALTLVRDAVASHGMGYADTLALGREDAAGRSRVIASGRELAKRAQKSASGHRS